MPSSVSLFSCWAVATLVTTTTTFTATSLAATQAPASASAPAPITAFVHVSVIPMDRERMLPDQTVLVQGGHIVALGRTGKVRLPPGTTIVEGQGKFLLPGLADMHVHLDQMNRIEGLAPETGLQLYLASGVTTVRNMRGDPDLVVLRDRVAKGELLGPRLYTAGPTVYNGEQIATSQAAQTLIAAQKAARYDFIKIYDMPELTPEAFDTFAALAHHAGMPFAGHAPAPVTIERLVQARPASIDHLVKFVLYLVGINQYGKQDLETPRLAKARLEAGAEVPDAAIVKLARLMKQAGVWICPTALTRVGFASADTTDFQTFLHTERITRNIVSGGDAKSWLLRSRLIKVFHDAGVGLLAGSDGGPGGIYGGIPQLAPGGEVHAELQLFVEAGLTPYQALEAATRNPAAFLGALDSTGTVAVGKRADLVLVSGNPLEDIRQTQALVGTMLGGRWLPREFLNAQFAAAHVPERWYR